MRPPLPLVTTYVYTAHTLTNIYIYIHGTTLRTLALITSHLTMNVTTVTDRELMLRSPTRLTLSGSSGSGKTCFIEGFIKYLDQLVDTHIDKIVYAYGQYQSRFDEIARNHPNIIWVEGFPHDEIEEHMSTPDTHKLLICDDLMDILAGDKRFTAWYVRKSHHLLVNILFTVQNLFQPGLRTINLNTTAYCLFKSLRDQSQVRCLSMQMYGSKWRKMMEIYEDATRLVGFPISRNKNK